MNNGKGGILAAFFPYNKQLYFSVQKSNCNFFKIFLVKDCQIKIKYYFCSVITNQHGGFDTENHQKRIGSGKREEGTENWLGWIPPRRRS